MIQGGDPFNMEGLNNTRSFIYIYVHWLFSIYDLFLDLARVCSYSDGLFPFDLLSSWVFGNDWSYCLAQAPLSTSNLPFSFWPLESIVPYLRQLWGAIPDFSVNLRNWSAFYIRQDEVFDYLYAHNFIRPMNIKFRNSENLTYSHGR